MARNYLFAFILFLFLLTFPVKVYADSPYVLPYPSSMPGSVWYRLDLVKEALMQYWYFGDFSQFDYNLKQSDKYLVEAKTLFEYKQYLLGYSALIKSDSYFKKVWPSLISAQKHQKNIEEKNIILKDAAEKHIEILNKLKKEVPDTFVWTPEKDDPTSLDIGDALSNSIRIRANL